MSFLFITAWPQVNFINEYLSNIKFIIFSKEREGAYLGKTVQVIPHVVDEIKAWIRTITSVPLKHDSNERPEILLVEVGGTVGDLESTCYYEAVR